ncbi:MAG: IS3 family transposase [Flavobacteriales bacterium]|nr:IS3 family transposase [Flavobacteriales bacterium]
MKALHPKLGQEALCRSLGVSRQAHHKQARRTARVVQGQEEVLHRVRAIRQVQPRLGGLKLYGKLREHILQLPVPFGRDRFFDLLREEKLLIAGRKRRVRTTLSSHGLPVYPDLVKGLVIQRPGEVWVSDITYWAVEEGFYFIFLITDACSHKIIGHHVATSMDGEHAVAALRMAQKGSLHPLQGIIHHSDRGSQYCYAQYVKALRSQGMRISMTETSDPRDNAVAERVNGILKNELLAHHQVTSIAQAKALVEQAIAIYNTDGPHLSCDMLEPDKAHLLDHKPQRRWKNYYRTVNLSQDETHIVNPTQDLVL